MPKAIDVGPQKVNPHLTAKSSGVMSGIIQSEPVRFQN